jgi:hypothetical protein
MVSYDPGQLGASGVFLYLLYQLGGNVTDIFVGRTRSKFVDIRRVHNDGELWAPVLGEVLEICWDAGNLCLCSPWLGFHTLSVQHPNDSDSS